MHVDDEELVHPDFSPGTASVGSEVDGVYGDLRRKHESKAADSGGAVRAPAAPAWNDDEKLRLALRTSEASAPGAVHHAPGRDPSRAKPTQFSQLASFARFRRSAKEDFRGPARHKRDQNPGVFTNNTSVETLDEFQARMNDFKKDSNDAADMEEQRRKRRRRCLIITVAFVGALIATIAGAVVGTSGSDMAAPSSVDPSLENGNETCLERIQRNAALLERYELIQTVVVSECPSMAEAIDTPNCPARSALCWITDDDEFNIQVEQGLEFRVTDRFALALLYYRFSEQLTVENYLVKFSNWLTPVSVCEWEGVSCAEKEEISNLEVMGMDLRGGVPSEVALLRNLKFFNFASNTRSRATIPSELWTLTKLEYLWLYEANIIGTLSAGMQNLSRLIQFSASANALSGSIPDLSGLTTLTDLELVDTKINGTIPDFLVSTNIETLGLRRTMLSGTIPSIVGTSESLKGIYLSSPNLSGTIPSELGMLTGLEAIEVDGSSAITGTIPTELGDLTLLTSLDFSFMTGLTGSIPSELGRLTALGKLSFDGCVDMTGAIPSEVCSLRSKSLDSFVHWCENCLVECPAT